MVGLGALMNRRGRIQIDTLNQLTIYLLVPSFLFEQVAYSSIISLHLIRLHAIHGLDIFARAHRSLRKFAKKRKTITAPSPLDTTLEAREERLRSMLGSRLAHDVYVP